MVCICRGITLCYMSDSCVICMAIKVTLGERAGKQVSFQGYVIQGYVSIAIDSIVKGLWSLPFCRQKNTAI